MKPLVLLAILMLGSATASAESILITNATLLERGASVGTYDILIADGVIEQVTQDLAGAAVDVEIDAGGRPVTSAFFAGITALGLNEIGWFTTPSIPGFKLYTPA